MFDCPAFGQALYRRAREALLQHFAAYPDQHFYAAAFHHVELEQAVAPHLCCQSVENLPDRSTADEPVERWDCATWPKVLAVDDWLAKQMQALESLQHEQMPSQWNACVKQLEKELISVCKRLSSELRKSCTNLTADFAVLILDDDFRLTPKCVSKAQLLRLFPHLDEPRRRAEQIAKLPLEQQISIHLNALVSGDCLEASDAERALRRIGPFAATALARNLRDGKNSWRLALLLDHFCVRSEEAIDALKQLVLDQSDGSSWSASALATLGEYEFLLGRAELSDDTLARAFLHPLTWRHHHLDPVPLDYRPIEQLLHARPSTESLMLAEMERNSFGDITAKDVPVALAGAAHGFAGIRRHAAYVLGRKGLGKKNGKQIVAALLPLLNDTNRMVQYNTLVTLDTWSAFVPDDPKPFERLAHEHPLMHEHPHEAIRHVAARILAGLAQRAGVVGAGVPRS